MSTPRVTEVMERLARWVADRSWGARLAETLDEHRVAVCRAAGMRPAELERELGPARVQRLDAWALEDFVADHERDERVVNAFLERPGASESHAERVYLLALAASSPGLYEILDRSREGLLLHDLLFQGPVMEVRSGPGVVAVASVGVVAGRLLELDGVHAMPGTVLPFEPPWDREAVISLETLVTEAEQLLAQAVADEGLPHDFVRRGVIANSASTLSDTWVIAMTRARHRPRA